MTKKGESLRSIIKGSLSYLDTCTEFRNNEKPIEVKKLVKKAPRAQSSPVSDYVQFLKRVNEAESDYFSGNPKSCLKKAEEVMKALQTQTDLQQKDELLEALHRCMGGAHLELGDDDKALEHFRQNLEQAEKCKLHQERSRALDDMGRAHAQAGRFEQAIDCLEKRIPLVHGALEQTWLFHELGCWHLELDRLEEARKYGVRSVAAAHVTGDVKWQMNSNFLLAQSELKLEDYESAISHFEVALNHAKQQDAAAQSVIQEILDKAKQHLPQNEEVHDEAKQLTVRALLTEPENIQ